MIEFTEAKPANAEDIARCSQGLTEHSLEYMDKPGFQNWGIYASVKQNEVIGAVIGMINWNWLYVSLLWVHADWRKKGIGAQLLKHMEDFAISQGCRQAHLDTFGFQAPDFYPRMGYTLFAELENYPPGYSRYFYRKRLAGTNPVEL